MGIDFVSLALDELERWDSQLVELVRDAKINPWDIDITLLTAKYLERINEMKKLDFRIPAKAVITAAVLLRLKSEKLSFEPKAWMERETAREESRLPMDLLSVPDLHPVRRAVERKITIVELVDALRSAFEVEKRKLMRNKRLGQIVRIDRINMATVMSELRVILDDLFHAREAIELTDLVKYKDFAILFLALLHLANHDEIDLEQDEWNGPIRIRRPIVMAVAAQGREDEKDAVAG